MPALHGRLLVESVLRPFGEHLAAMVRAQPGDACLDLSGDGGVLAGLLSRACGPDGDVVACDDDAAVVAEIAEAARLLRLHNVHARRASGTALPARDGSIDVATSLFALAHHAEPEAVLRELLRVVAPDGGRLACAMWSEPDASPHEGVLLTALREVTGDAPEALTCAVELGYPEAAENLLAEALGGAASPTQVVRIHDVVRFDGVAQYWAAMVDERPTAAAVRALPADVAERVRNVLAERLSPYAAADGTLRIPTEAVVIVRGG